MYLGKRKENLEPISIELILSKIGDYDIYRYELGNFTIGTAFCNPLRKDKNPSMVIYMGQSGHLFHRDYADDNYKGGCFDLICQKYGLTLDKAIEKVATDFGIKNRSSQEYKKIISQYTKPILDIKKHALIQVSVRRWEEKDLEYWKQYGITLDQLKREEVYCVNEWFLNRKKQVIRPGELCFTYRYAEGFKIYRPERSSDDGKWISNITTKEVENLAVLKEANKVLIVKSKKDRLTLENIVPDLAIVNVQNESTSAYTDEFLNVLKNKDVWISFDSDPPGKKASIKITTEFGYKHINVPDRYFEQDGIKDWADLYKIYGKEPIIEHLKQKSLI